MIMKRLPLSVLLVLLAFCLTFGGCNSRKSSYDDDDTEQSSHHKKKKKKKRNRHRDDDEFDGRLTPPEDPPYLDEDTVPDVDEFRDPNDPNYTPYRYAITAGSDGGQWEDLESGERVYHYPVSDTYARAVWVQDGDQIYYVDASGCLMKDNWAHDGCYAGSDGTWRRDVRLLITNVEPVVDRSYKHDSGTEWVFHRSSGGMTAVINYSFGYTESYKVEPFGHSAYRLRVDDDDFQQAHATVTDGGRVLRVSQSGATTVYELSE